MTHDDHTASLDVAPAEPPRHGLALACDDAAVFIHGVAMGAAWTVGVALAAGLGTGAVYFVAAVAAGWGL